jgi:hypothetical protein
MVVSSSVLSSGFSWMRTAQWTCQRHRRMCPSFSTFDPALDHDITLTFLVVGEEGIRMTTKADWHGVYLKPNAMERVKEGLSRNDVWGLKRGGRDKKSGVWKVMVRFRHRTRNSFEGGEFDSVVICYDPRWPRKSFELVWTKVCPGLLLRHKCSKIVGH